MKTDKYNMKIIDTKIYIDEFDKPVITLDLMGMSHGVTITYPINMIDKIFKLTGTKNYDNIKGSFVQVIFEDHLIKLISNIIENDWYYSCTLEEVEDK